MRLPPLVLSIVAGFAHAQTPPVQNWIEYYRSGTIEASGKVIWDYNEIDVDSVRREGKHIRYLVRIRYGDGSIGKPEQMQVDCGEKTRGQLPDPRMSRTYKGTLGGDEVLAACAVAERRAI
jgi:hypothetical protein